MNKFYAAAAALGLIASGAQAQRAGSHNGPANVYKLEKQSAIAPAKNRVAANAQRDVIFEEDFSNGLAGNNGVGAWTLNGPNGNVWRYTHSGPVGAYSDPDQAIESPTAADGWMIFNSDSANTNWNVDPPVIVGSPVDLVGSLVSPVLDLSATPDVEIRFFHKFRFCCAANVVSHILDISTDGGTTWPAQYSIGLDEGVSGNTDSGTRQFAAVITNAISANPANVRFRFRHDGTGGVSHYHWQIDDITLNAVPPYELIMDYGYLSQYGGGFEYHRVPQNQMLDNVEVGGAIINYGLNTQHNVTFLASLRDENDVEVASATTNLGTIESGDTAFADLVMNVPSPMELGRYTCHFSMTSDDIDQDADQENNTAVRYIAITSDMFALDGIGVIPSADLFLGSGGTDAWTANTIDVRLMTYFEVKEQETFTGVEIYLTGASSTSPGSYFIGAVYDTASVLSDLNTMLENPLVESDFRVIDAADIAVRTTAVSFTAPITLQPGGYFVSANLYQEGGANLRILDDLTVPQPGMASMIWLPVDNQGAGRRVWGNGNAWAVRLSSLLNVAVQKNPGLQGVILSPNPNDGKFTVQMPVGGSSTVEVFNPLGQLVQTSSFNGTSTSLDLSGMGAGVYTVRIGNNGNHSVQRVVVQ